MNICLPPTLSHGEEECVVAKRDKQLALVNESGLVRMWQLCARFAKLEFKNYQKLY